MIAQQRAVSAAAVVCASSRAKLGYRCGAWSSMNDNFALRDQVVLITGGARRVGAEIARTLHAAGANVLIHYRSSAAAAIALADEFNRMRPHSAAILAAHLLTRRCAGEIGRRGAARIRPPGHFDQQCLELLSDAGRPDHPAAMGRSDGQQPEGAAVPVAGGRTQSCGRDADSSSIWSTFMLCVR